MVIEVVCLGARRYFASDFNAVKDFPDLLAQFHFSGRCHGLRFWANFLRAKMVIIVFGAEEDAAVRTLHDIDRNLLASLATSVYGFVFVEC